MDTHHNQVLAIASQVARFHEQKIPFRIYHGSTNSTRTTIFSDETSIDTSNLKNVISIDPQAHTCLLESNVPMDALVAETLKYGLIPPVVPEFPGITVGGAFSGTGGESTSFRHGFFDQCVNWVEVILANGDIVTASASASELPDLFYGMAGTFGTLGVATLFEIQLIPAKAYVELTYHIVNSFERAQEKIADLTSSSSKVDFVDGIMYSAASGVICSGSFVDIAEYEFRKVPKVARFSRSWDQWFYIYVSDILQRYCTSVALHKDLIATDEYLFRYDRGAFWTGCFVFRWFGVPFNRLTRFLLNWLMSTRILFHGLHASGLGEGYIIQDLCIPEAQATKFAQWMDSQYAFYPLWLCPIKQNERVSMNPHVRSLVDSGRTNGEAFLNIGVWTPCPQREDNISCNRNIEHKLQSLQGMKWLYADTFYTEEEFWTVYDREWYEHLRLKYGAQGLPNVYQKVKTRLRTNSRAQVNFQTLLSVITGKLTLKNAWDQLWCVWPLVGIKAVTSAWRGEDYLKKKTQ